MKNLTHVHATSRAAQAIARLESKRQSAAIQAELVAAKDGLTAAIHAAQSLEHWSVVRAKARLAKARENYALLIQKI